MTRMGWGMPTGEYGDFLRSAAVLNWRAAYSHGGFSDPSITYGNRLEKASEYYTKALAYYRIAETQELAAGKYDALTNVYYNMALSNSALGAIKEACVDYDRALQAYKDNILRNPTAHPQGTSAGTVQSRSQRQGRGLTASDTKQSIRQCLNDSFVAHHDG